MAASAQTQKTLLDAEALSRTLQRIAHEIVERNADLSKIAPRSGSTPGASRWPSGCAA